MERKTILIIDDEPDTLTFFSSLLEDNGYNTITAENGEEGFKRINEQKPDLITLDITMPEMSGVKYYRTIRSNEEWKSIPIIIITGIADDFRNFISTRKQVPPPDGYISKPVEEKELIELVETLLKK
ncbi:response regulator [Bacteroidota bacterium]